MIFQMSQISFAKLNLYHMCCISWHSSAIKLWKRDVLIVPLLLYFLIMENLNILRRSKVSNHHIFIYMLIVSGTTQSYILKYCISFNRAYFDNRSQKSMYHQRLVKRKNTLKLTDLCNLYYMFGFLRFTECYVV